MITVAEERSVERGSVDGEATRLDHEAIRRLAARLEAMLGKLVAHDTSDEAAMPPLLAEFREVLGLYLDQEEQSGVLETAAAKEPRFAVRIEQLIREYADLRKAVDRICDGPDGHCWGDFEVRFASFRTALAEHERAENDVLMAVYLEDIGGHN